MSNFVQVDYATGMAHAVYNGFTILPGIDLRVWSYPVDAQMIIDEFESAEMAKATGDTLGAAQAKACRVRKILRERYGERIAA